MPMTDGVIPDDFKQALVYPLILYPYNFGKHELNNYRSNSYLSFLEGIGKGYIKSIVSMTIFRHIPFGVPQDMSLVLFFLAYTQHYLVKPLLTIT
jgi:hypothetical protein